MSRRKKSSEETTDATAETPVGEQKEQEDTSSPEEKEGTEAAPAEESEEKEAPPAEEGEEKEVPPAEEGEEKEVPPAEEKPRRRSRRRKKTPSSEVKQEEPAVERKERPAPSKKPRRREKPASPTFPGGPVLAFNVLDQRYALPVKNIFQIIDMVEITRLPAAPRIIIGVIDFHGQVIPVVDMRRRLKLPSQPYQLHTPILITQLEERTVGIVVDQVSEVVELSPHQIEAPSRIFTEEMALQVHHLNGIARLSDGLVLLLEPTTFLSAEEEESLEEALAENPDE
jgi:purine-binding chemotaxis protein CheW